MRALRFFLCAVVALGSSAFVAGQAQQPSPEQPTRSDGCKSYFALQPLDQGVLKSLATPIVPPNPNLFANESVRQLQEWDLPSKVTTWHDRPSPEELARRWDELNKKWNSATPGKSGVPRPYALQPLPPNDWKDLEKWFAKEGPKRISGMCVEPGEATYVLAVGGHLQRRRPGNAVRFWGSRRIPAD